MRERREKSGRADGNNGLSGGNAMNLFDKVKCKGFYKPFKDGRWLYLDRKTLTADAMDNNLADGNNDGTVEKNVEYIEKTYFKHVDRNFIGVIVGYKNIIVKGYLDAVYQDECDVGVGVIPETFYVSKRAKETVKCAVVYYGNNMKHYVPLEDVLEVMP
nr:MAG TPA: hypothetical protein [Caudoviricetes sp.]